MSPDLSDVAIGIAGDRIDESKVTVYDKTMHDYNKLYPIMLKICAASEGKQDTARAVDIAFQTYEKMIHRGLKPRGKSFELIYCTVDKYIRNHPELPEFEKRKLRDKVFAEAEANKVTRGELIGRWQQVLVRSGMTEDESEGSEGNESKKEENDGEQLLRIQ